MKNNREVFQSFSMIMQFGINMLVPIFACTLFGSWLAVPFFALGALAGMRNVFLFARRIYDPKKKDEDKSDVKKAE